MMQEINAAGEVVSAVTMKRVPRGGVVFAISHNERTELLEAQYLLAPEHRLGNLVFIGEGKEREIVELQRERERNMSPQALRNPKSQVFFEFVGTLPRIKKGDDVQEYLRICQERLQKIVNFYEATEGQKYKTKKGKLVSRNPGMKCVHGSIHLDEGSINKLTGEVQYNAHYHLIFDRKTPEGIMWKPGPNGLSEFQTVAAECLQMQRGTTYEERGNKRSRKHIEPATYREIAEEFNAQLNAERVKTAEVAARVEYLERENAALSLNLIEKAREMEEKRLYDVLRAFLKGTGKAKQSDYQKLKKIYQEDRPLFDALCEVLERSDTPDAEELFWRLRGGEVELLAEKRENAAGLIGSNSREVVPGLDADLVIDPFIRWNPNGEDLYLLPERDEKRGRLAFRDCGNHLNLRLDDDKTIIAALVLARQKWPDGPILVNGSPEFVSRCIELGRERGILVEPKRDKEQAPGPAAAADDAPLLNPRRGGPAGPRR